MPLSERKNEDPLTLAVLVGEVRTLNGRFLRYRVISVIALAMFILGAWAIWSNHETTNQTKHAVHIAQDAIDQGRVRDARNAADQQCTANYLNAQRARQIELERVSGRRVVALDNEIRRLNQVLRAAINEKSPALVQRLSHRLLIASHQYDKAIKVYHEVLKKNPIPKLQRYTCAAIAARRDHNHPLSPTPTVTKTVTAGASTVPVPGSTTTVTQYATRTEVITRRQKPKVRFKTVTVTATPSCAVSITGRCIVP